MNRRTQFGLLAFLAVITGLSIYGLVYHILAKQTMSPPDVVLSAGALTDAYDNSEGHADSLYLYKKLSVKGALYRLHKNESGQYVATLEGRSIGHTAVDCILDSLYSPMPPEVKRGDTLIIRGRCDGRSLNVILVQCIIEK